MNNVNQTLYIPLYGKAYVTNKNIILNDLKAVEIWQKEGFSIKGKAKSKWLSYYMAMRARVFDQWVEKSLIKHPNAIVLHIGCGLDNRYGRIQPKCTHWYDVDFDDVIKVRKQYYKETEYYHMISCDMRDEALLSFFDQNADVIVVMEGVSMYLPIDDLKVFFTHIAHHFKHVDLLMDAYSRVAAKMSKYKNPINEVGVYEVYGIDQPELLNVDGLCYKAQHDMTPQELIDELSQSEKMIFRKLYAGKFASRLYQLYEFEKDGRE